MDTCGASPTRTQSSASGRALICQNTVALLKGPSARKKKCDGGRTRPYSACSTKVRFGGSHHIHTSCFKILHNVSQRTKYVDKLSEQKEPDIMGKSHEKDVNPVHFVCKLDKSIYSVVSSDNHDHPFDGWS